MSVLPIDAITALNASAATRDLAAASPVASPGVGFASLIEHGISDLEHKVTQADQLARAFVLDDTVPLHQVTFAMEEARMSLDLMLQVRTRIVDAYQQLMGMQL